MISFFRDLTIVGLPPGFKRPRDHTYSATVKKQSAKSKFHYKWIISVGVRGQYCLSVCLILDLYHVTIQKESAQI